MSKKEDRARLIITVPQAAIDDMLARGKFEYAVVVNMQDFASNLDDMVHIEVEYVTPVLLSANNTFNYQLPIEVLVDLPQQYSYDAIEQTSTRHLALLERDNGVMQSAAFTTLANLLKDNTARQLWSFKQKPMHMTIKNCGASGSIF